MRNYLIALSLISVLTLTGTGCKQEPNAVNAPTQDLIESSSNQEQGIEDTIVEKEEEVSEQKSYTTYSGAYFDIEYPSSFTIDERILDESLQTEYAEVAFISPNKNVEFYVFSPLWSGVSVYETIADNEEIVAEQESSTGEGFDKKTVNWITVEAKDGSYARSMRIITTNDETVRYLFGIKYNSQDALDEVREDYDHFTNSLIQYADA